MTQLRELVVKVSAVLEPREPRKASTSAGVADLTARFQGLVATAT